MDLAVLMLIITCFRHGLGTLFLMDQDNKKNRCTDNLESVQ